MLTLGMAFIAKPRLLMIDELSLGLAPDRRRAAARRSSQAIRDRGTTIILVEQSVNVALTLAETAYFMEKGEIRFHGPTAELLDRPDILRSVFLEGADVMTAADEPAADSRHAAAATVAGAPPARRRVARAWCWRSTRLTRSFGGVRAVDDVSLRRATQGEILGIIGPNGAGKTTLFDLISGYMPARPRPAAASAATTSPRCRPTRRAAARASAGRSRTPGCSPALTVDGDHRARARAPRRGARPVRRRARACRRSRESRATVRAAGRRAHRAAGPRAFRAKFVRELSTGTRRIVDLACLLAHEPDGLLLDEPSSGIAQREAEALGPLLQRIRAATGAQHPRHRARHAARHVDLRRAPRPRPRAGHRPRARRRSCCTTPGSWRPTWAPAT